MTLKYPIKEHWEAFKKKNLPAIVEWIETILGEEITQEAFVISWTRIKRGHGKANPARAKREYRFLTENDWIKKG